MTTIHVWSDYVCPFCLIADEVIERAIADMDDVQVVHHPHELRPYPTPTLRPEAPYLPSIWERAVYPMARRYGVPMELPRVSPQPYTAPAFRGAALAEETGKGAHYHRRVLTAFFREGLNIGDPDVLTRLARDVGIDGDTYRSALSDSRYKVRHDEALAHARALNISVVPTIIIGTRRLEGVASEDVIRRAVAENRAVRA